MLSIFMRVFLVFAGILNLIYIITEIKRTKLLISEAIFWFIVSGIIALFGVFPEIPIWFANLAGVESPVNLVYLFFIAILFFKLFQLSVENSKQGIKIDQLISKLAVAPKETEDTKILLIIPCFNERDNICQVIESIHACDPERKYYDYIVVNDGSVDGTDSVLEKNKINHITHLVNCGLNTAFKSGCRYAIDSEVHYDAVCQFDADGQHLADNLDKLRQVLEEKTADVVIGSRYLEGNSSGSNKMKGISRKMITGCIRLFTGVKIADPTSGMRMYRDTVYPLFVDDINLNPEPDGLVYFLKRGFVVQEVPVEMNERLNGKSYLTIGAAINYMINIIGSIIIFQWWRD